MEGYALSGKGLAKRTSLSDPVPGPCNVSTCLTAAAARLTGGRLMAAAALAPRSCHAKPERDAFQRHNERSSP
jgi:hypothetical protein